MSSMMIHQYCTAYQMQARDASKLQSASVWLFDNDFVWLHCAAILFTVCDASTMECITRCDASSLQSASVASDREEDISSGARLLLLWASDGLYVILPEYRFEPQKIQHRHYITDTKSCAIMGKKLNNCNEFNMKVSRIDEMKWHRFRGYIWCDVPAVGREGKDSELVQLCRFKIYISERSGSRVGMAEGGEDLTALSLFLSLAVRFVIPIIGFLYKYSLQNIFLASGQ